MEIAVIGGGASGIISAIEVAKKGHSVTIFERNKPLKKLLLTGNGKCNYWNKNIDYTKYHTNDKDILRQIINNNKDYVLPFFDSIGIVPKIKDNYYYPNSENAASIREALLRECKLYNIKIVNELVENIDNFSINGRVFDKVILSTGSKAYPKTGSDGIGYKILRQLGHTIINPKPALSSIKLKESLFPNVRCEGLLKLDGKQEYGCIQFTPYNISGICVFNISTYVKENSKLKVNFLKSLDLNDKEEVYSYLIKRKEQLKTTTAIQFLEGILDYRIVKVILKKSNIKEDTNIEKLDKQQLIVLSNNLCNFDIPILKVNEENAQVYSGGVALNEINPDTMESKIIKNLYIIGELLDVDGPCGGYNLGFAWISGICAGRNI